MKFAKPILLLGILVPALVYAVLEELGLMEANLEAVSTTTR